MHVSAVYRATHKKDDQFISLISKLESTHLLACFSEYTPELNMRAHKGTNTNATTNIMAPIT